jgi:hypothetical protein
MNHVRCLVFLSLFSTQSIAQDTPGTPSPLILSAYLEPYYLYSFNQPADHNLPAFVYSHNRHHEVNINLGFIKAAYATSKTRANLALMAGTYTQANLAGEPPVLRHLFEANGGIRLSKKRALWLDAGVFASHIGFESAIGKDCWTLSRSMMADNSPYYESGVKLGYTSPDQRWFASVLFLNGWQRIQRVPGNQTPAFGHQLTFKPNDRITLNSSSYVGSEQPDSLRKMRYFHNLYGIFQASARVGIIAGFDIGAEQTEKNSSRYNTWFTPVAILRISIHPKWNLAIRGEYFQDESGVLIASGAPNGFQTWGYSGNLDFKVSDQASWRLEYRRFSGKEKIFERSGMPTRHNAMVASALVLAF